MELARILITEYGDQQMIFLREVNGDRHFPILIGLHEALAIDRRLKGRHPPRPMTHELLTSVIDAMGGRVQRAVINDLRQHTFIATLYIEQDGRVEAIDARPSDAIALSAGLGTPIFVSEKVLTELDRSAKTKEDRLQLLRDRLVALQEHIDELSQQLADEAFCNTVEAEELQRMREHLEAMESEHQQIKQVLDKLS